MVMASNRPLNRKSRKAAQHSFKEMVAKSKKTGNWGEWKDFSDKIRDPSFAAIAPQGVWKIFANNFCSVQISRINLSSAHGYKLGIRLNDQSTHLEWSDIQRIKNELLGEVYEGIQIFPREQDLVDEANMYWLWVLPHEKTLADYGLPFSL